MHKLLTTFRAALLLCLALVLSAEALRAAHIVGGEVTYRCLGEVDGNSRRYRLEFMLLRDGFTTGAEFDGTPGGSGDFEYTVFLGSRIIRRVTIPFSDFVRSEIDLSEEASAVCTRTVPRVAVERGVYVSEIVLPISDEEYTISYQRCCRNETIVNIVNPGAAGATYLVTIPAEAQRSCNASPVFNNLPPVVICQNFLLDIDGSASDADGDSLSYKLCDPYYGGGTDQEGDAANGPTGVIPNPETPPPYEPVVFLDRFSSDDPIDGRPSLSIDEATGRINVRPLTVGQYVVCVSVEEWRNGVLMGVVRRDFQFNVTECTTLVNARVNSPTARDSFDVAGGVQFLQFCGSRTGTVVNASTGGDRLAGVEWTFYNTSEGTVVDTGNVVEVTFPDYGIYDARLIALTGQLCDDTLNFELRVTPPTQADIVFDYDSCVYGPVRFRDQSFTEAESIDEYRWDFGGPAFVPQALEQSILFTRAGLQTVSLEVVDNNGCLSTDLVQFEYFPVPGRLPGNLVGAGDCAPAASTYAFEFPFITDEYDFFWDFGDGSSSSDRNPEHTYANPGVYNTYLSLLSPHACFADTQLTTPITVLESPVADFTFSPEVLDSRNTNVQLRDASISASTWTYTFGNDGISRERNPLISLPDSGLYPIRLAISHLNGCVDTITKQLRVDPYWTYYLPNAFTPNSDGDNDRFRGLGIDAFLEEFRMRIFTRWGEMIYETDDETAGWDGTSARNGGPAKPDVYLYIVEFTSPDGPERLEGFVTLVR